MERLEIYNEREKKSFEIDLKPDNSVSLQLKSNIFSPIDKVTLNHSFSITAPDTLQNRRAFGMANQVAADSEQVRMKFPCKFYRNGVLLLNGTCHVQAIENSSFSLLLVWGLDCLEALKEAGDLADLDLGLGRMTFEGLEGGKPVPDYNTYAEAMEKHMFFAHSVGDFAERNKWNLSATEQFTPCIAARTVWKKCLESAGISYEVDETAFEFMKRLALPLPTLDSGELEINIGGVGRVDPDIRESYFQFSDAVQLPCYYIKGFATDLANVTVTDGKIFGVASKCDAKLNFHLSGDGLLPYWIESVRLCVVEYDEEGQESSREYKKLDYTRFDLLGTKFVYYYEEIELSTSGKADFYFVFHGTNHDVLELTFDKFIAEFTEPPITAGTELSIEANLPKISQMNYVKAICQICGIFPIPPVEGSNVVRFVTPGILKANKNNAVNWSGYVNGEPKKIYFAFSDFAQNNLITYKDGEKHAASFSMESPTADKEKTAFELPFMHLVGGRWPLWSVEEEEEDDKKEFVWSREKVDPAIYCLRPSGGDENTDAYLSFDELTPTMILSRWQPLADTLKRAKVIQVELLLPQIAVKYVDYSVPVYIEQFGGYFGIVSLTNAGDKTTAELIKI